MAAVAPAEVELRERFVEALDYLDAELFEKTLFLLKGLPEVGVILQVEKELPALVRSIFGEHGALFQKEDIAQWRKAEARLQNALAAFVHEASSTYRGRLFAEDALQGLRVVDVCREFFDVVVMNPPFGALSSGAKDAITTAYPNSKNDLLAVFVERGLDRLRQGGRLGAVTSRTCFFLTSFTDWRKNVVLRRSALEVIADLGQGVMDDAMVEAAAYVLERGSQSNETVVIRSIADEDRKAATDTCAAAIRRGGEDHRIFLGQAKTFASLPDSPFVYWVRSETIRCFYTEMAFEPDVGNVRQGLATGDDSRFVRGVWESRPEDTQFCYYPTNGEDFCRLDDPVVQPYLRRRTLGRQRWAFHVKAGASQPWYSPITLKINWGDDGAELRNFTDQNGKLRSRPQNTFFYYRPGFSWTRRAVRFYPYVIPANCIPSVSRYMAFPELGREAEALGVCASTLASAFLRFYGEKFEFPNFLVDNVKKIPSPKLGTHQIEFFKTLISRQVDARRRAYQNFEPFHEFVLPTKIQDYTDGGTDSGIRPNESVGEKMAKNWSHQLTVFLLSKQRK